MTTAKITTVKRLHEYLHAAMKIEHATIPPYLTALYSIHPQTNSDAVHVIRVVAVEEMLHLTLAANLLNAVGGTPDLTAPEFVPTYPTKLPDGEDDFEVSRERFSKDCIKTFLNIERPGKAADEASRIVTMDEDAGVSMLATVPGEPELRFYSIGEFYTEIKRGLKYLRDELHDDLFIGNPARQVGPEYYYSGGGEVIVVTDFDTACEAIDLITEQGEGLGGGIHDDENELAHYYRFKQIKNERYYESGDEPGHPTGPELSIDWDAVYPIKANACVDDYPDGSELQEAALRFNASYADFLRLLTRAYTGNPQLLLGAVADMFRIRTTMTQLMRNPIPGQHGVNAAPTFEMPVLVGAAA
ncbi:MAG TPA: ferritin-like protein [Solirubrobacteraceae bacterium]